MIDRRTAIRGLIAGIVGSDVIVRASSNIETMRVDQPVNLWTPDQSLHPSKEVYGRSADGSYVLLGYLDTISIPLGPHTRTRAHGDLGPRLMPIDGVGSFTGVVTNFDAAYDSLYAAGRAVSFGAVACEYCRVVGSDPTCLKCGAPRRWR